MRLIELDYGEVRFPDVEIFSVDVWHRAAPFPLTGCLPACGPPRQPTLLSVAQLRGLYVGEVLGAVLAQHRRAPTRAPRGEATRKRASSSRWRSIGAPAITQRTARRSNSSSTARAARRPRASPPARAAAGERLRVLAARAGGQRAAQASARCRARRCSRCSGAVSRVVAARRACPRSAGVGGPLELRRARRR